MAGIVSEWRCPLPAFLAAGEWPPHPPPQSPKRTAAQIAAAAPAKHCPFGRGGRAPESRNRVTSARPLSRHIARLRSKPICEQSIFLNLFLFYYQ